MTLVIKTEDDTERTPHLALTHNELQGGAANKRNVSLLMKSDVENVSEEILKALESLGVSEVKKAAFYSQMRTVLQTAVRDKFKPDENEWLYVEDFNDSVVIFCNDKGLFSVEYSVVNGDVVIADLASPVQSVIVYNETSGKMLLSEDAEDKLEEGVYSLVTKSLQNETTIEHLKDVFKAQTIKQNEELALQEEILKAVEAAESVLKAQLVEKEELLTKALEQVAAYQAEKEEAVVKSRKEAIAEVEKDEVKAEELFKSLEALPQESFDVVIKSLKAKVELVENSDLFVQKSKDSDVEIEEESGTAAILKAKYSK